MKALAASLCLLLAVPAAAEDAPRAVELTRCYDAEERARIAARIVGAEKRVEVLEAEIRAQPPTWLFVGIIVGAVVVGGAAGFAVAKASQ